MTALDASFLFMEDASTPMHAGGVASSPRRRAASTTSAWSG